MKHYFLDTNVVLDFLARRDPFAATALEIFRAGLDKRATLYVASLSFTTIYYVLRRQTKAANARAAVAQLAKLVTVVAVDAAVVQQAIASDWADFEDGIQYFTALSVPHADALATRNARDFTPSTLAILTPQQAVGNFTF